MIQSTDSALKALHLVLCHARTMALLGENQGRIAAILDWAELLPQYLAADEDRTAEFESALAALAELEPELQIVLHPFVDPEPARH